MTTTRLSLAVAIGAVLGITAQPAAAKELSVATFEPSQHHTNTGMFAWIGEKIERRSGGSLTVKLYPAGQLGAGPDQQYISVVEGVLDPHVAGLPGQDAERYAAN